MGTCGAPRSTWIEDVAQTSSAKPTARSRVDPGPGLGMGSLSLTLLDVFRMGTSFSELILASKSSHARPVFWKRILGGKQGQGQ